MRKLALVFVAIGALAFAITACGDDTTKKTDAKPKKLDGKVTQEQDTGTPGKEGTTGKEAGVQKEAGGGTAGYGDACDPASPTNTCAAGFDCVGIQGFTKGWCTKQCTDQLKVCPDMPLATGPYAGAAAWCALSRRMGKRSLTSSKSRRTCFLSWR